MTPEEAKKLLPLIQALAAGERIECFDLVLKKWFLVANPDWTLPPESYRIQPKIKYRPFANRQELMEAIKDKGAWVQCEHPLWTISILNFGDNAVVLSDKSTHGFKEFVESFSFFDGTPCGVRKE